MHTSLPVMRLYLPLTLLFGLLLLTGCDKDHENFIATNIETINGLVAPATVNVFGQLTDNSGAPVAEALVVAGNKQTYTDQQGLWRIDAATVGATMGYITFSSKEHLTGSRTIYAREGSTFEVNVEMLRRDQQYTVAAIYFSSNKLRSKLFVGISLFRRTWLTQFVLIFVEPSVPVLLGKEDRGRRFWPL